MMFGRVTAFVMVLMSCAGVSAQVDIRYTYTDVAELPGDSDRWLVEWTVRNETAVPVEDFVIYFDFGAGADAHIAALRVEADIDEWTELVIQPSAPQLDGYYEAFADGVGIGPGEELGLFSASFDWSGEGTPPEAQLFEIYDIDFNLLASGWTEAFSGACCSAGSGCEELTEEECEAQMGLFLGGGTACDPNLCPECFRDDHCNDGLGCTDDFCERSTGECSADPKTCGALDLTLHAEDGCFKSDRDVCVTIDISELDGQTMVGGQFFLEYNACLLNFVAMAPGDHPKPGIAPCIAQGASPFSSEIFELVTPPDPNIDPCIARIAYAVGLPLGGQPSAANNTMATIHFRTIVPYPGDPNLEGQGDGVIAFDLDHVPATQLSDSLGTPNFPVLGPDIPITVDDNPPDFACPDIENIVSDPGVCTTVVGAIPCTVEDHVTAESPGCGLCSWSATRSDGQPLAAPYPAGTTCLEWTAADCAGNSSSHTQCVTVNDAEDPMISCPADIRQPNDAGECGAVVTYDEPVVADNCPGATWACDHPSGSFFEVGTTTVTCIATDAHGNTATCSFSVSVPDEEPPTTVLCPPEVIGPTDPGECSAAVDPGMAPCTDNCECAVTCSRDDGLDCWTDRYPMGTTVLTWTATDPAGHSETCEQRIVVRDEEDPTIDCPEDITQTADPGACGAIVAYPDPTVGDNCPEPAPTWVCDHPSGSFFEVGTTPVCCTATDASDNTATCCFDVTITDDEDPTIACPEDITQPADPGECGAIVTYPDPTVNDNCPGATWACDHPSGSFFDVGTTTVCCTATDADAAGNSAGCCFDVTVKDEEAPEVVCPPDITQSVVPGTCSAVIDPGMATCTDNCGDCTVTCTRSDGLDCRVDPYPVGATIVRWCATDTANPANEGCCEQLVTVVDDEDPTIACPPDVTQRADPGECGAIVTYPDPTVEDNCPGATWACDPPGPFFDVGTTTVCCTATDASGNTAECCFDVTVEDEEAPEVVCPPNITRSADPGECSAVVGPDMATCTDNCGNCSVSCERDDGQPLSAPYPVGTTTITCTASDDSPDSPDSECSYMVTITDDEPPTIDCSADRVVDPDAGVCCATVEWACDVNDNCPGVVPAQPPYCDPPSGTCFDAGGVVNVLCRAADAAGNPAEQAFSVTVGEETVLNLVMRSEAASLNGSCDRCISFKMHDCASGLPAPGFADEHLMLSFMNGVASTELRVPCGGWTCMSAKDDLHALENTVELEVCGTEFCANFTGVQRLFCGDADDNNVVDINDYAVLFTQYMTWPDVPPNACDGAAPPPPYHSDFDCDGRVTTGDFLCILFNFLVFGDEPDACCGQPTRIVSRIDGPESNGKPIGTEGDILAAGINRRLAAKMADVSVSVEEIAETIGLEAAIAADLDGNGVVDVEDMALFAQESNIVVPERFEDIRRRQASPVDDGARITPRR